MTCAQRAVVVLFAALVAFDGPASAQSPPPAPTGALVAPRLLSEPSVSYPLGASGIATVVLIVTVNADGSVRSALPAQSDQEPFASEAMRAARTWRFDPATRDDKPVPAKIRVEIVFKPPAAPLAPVRASAGAAPTIAPRSAAPGRGHRVEEVLVRGAREEPSRSATLSRAEVRQIPGTFGDPFRAIEILPGVTPIVSGLPFFFVRGAPPGDVGYFLDGIRVPYLFHVGAGPSVIHPAILDRVDLYPGGYPARFGRFSGGIVSGETAPPIDVLHGEYNVRLFDAGMLAETPVAGGRGTVLLGGRYSYTALLLSLLSPSTTLDYWDYQARASYDVTPRDQIGVFAFGARDYLAQKGTSVGTQTIFDAQFHRIDMRYDHALGDRGTTRAALTGGIDYTVVGTGIYVRDRLIGARDEVTYPVLPTATLRVGADVQIDAYDVTANDAQQTLGSDRGAFARVFPSRTDATLGARADVVLDLGRGFRVTPGLRLDVFESDGATAAAIDPRLAMRAVLSDRASFIVALGLAHEVPAFVIPVPGFQPGGLRGGLQTAAQESMGVEVDLGEQTRATATVFHNAFFDMSDALVHANGAGQLPGGTATQSAAQAIEQRTDGTAFGLELMCSRKVTKHLGGFFSYTLSRSIRVADGARFVAPFDRTHVLNAAAAYDLGRDWRMGMRVTFYTGLPRAPDPMDASTRLSPFFRLDLRIEKRWRLGPKAWISFVAEWMNATLSKEAVGTQCTDSGCQESTVGPVTIPSLGVEGGF